ncbi:protoporphyrinogen oxidase [Myxococcota bacterium]|nr:protoporphyrinogen oxidase [Myxococcota bacterium]MCZ7619570.1 protoporphyrinogen oxidase [Myxococcota bacterium]
MTAPDVDVAIIGAGAAGLAAATVLRAAGREVVVLEAEARAGGSACTERRDGYLIERGANTFRLGPGALAFLRGAGLESRVLAASPASRERFLLRGGRLVPVPMGPLELVRTPLLSARGKFRLLAEPFVRRGNPSGESVAEFAARRLGSEAVPALIGPFLTGVYAGDETRLGAEAVFPSLVAAERRGGSIVRGLLAPAFERGRPRGRAGSWSTADGLLGLIDAMASALGPRLQLQHRASGIRFEEGSYHIEIEGKSSLRARGLVVALPAPTTAGLLAGLEPEAGRELATIEYAPVASVSVGVDPGAVREPIRGFGFLVPCGEGEALLGGLFLSALFPGRAPAGRELVTMLAGGMRRPDVLAEPDDRLSAMLLRDLDVALGLRGDPEPLGIARWPRAVPQPGRHHVSLVASVRTRLARFPRLALAGAAYDGVAFGDALASGAAAGQRLSSEES